MIDLSKSYGFGDVQSLAEGLSRLTQPAFNLAAIAVLIYLLIGALKYLTSSGDKNALSEAQNMITHAIIGFVLLVLLFLIMKFIPEALGLPGLSVIK